MTMKMAFIHFTGVWGRNNEPPEPSETSETDTSSLWRPLWMTKFDDEGSPMETLDTDSCTCDTLQVT